MTQLPPTDRATAPIIPPQLAIKAMRDSGYKNTAYALAELIDNSVQAKADAIDLICIEESRQGISRSRRQLSEIGVLDNGIGMEPLILQLALQFGNGTHLDDRSGIGRFGMGLPNSSISQCRRVDVWTWQNGPDNAIHTYLDVDEVTDGALTSIQFPMAEQLPPKWRSLSQIVSTTGTLVLWSKLDDHRLTWRGARATLSNTASIVGRMYRHFIHDGGKLRIGLKAISDGDVTTDEVVKANDPLYLMSPSSTPHPFEREPMFQQWGEADEIFTIQYGEDRHDVAVRMSWARQETVPEMGDRGAQQYGKHASNNLGVSIVRAGRELDLDRSWTNSYDPVERWWGVEVQFPPALDEVFGVTNSKQSATIFSNMAQFDWKLEADAGESLSEFTNRIREEGDPRSYLIPIVDHIGEQIGRIRTRLRDQTKGTRGGNNRHPTATIADVATKKYRQRAEEGHLTPEDGEEFTETDRDALVKDLKDDKNYSEDVAQRIATGVLQRNRKVEFVTKRMDGYAFFDVEHHQGGLTTIVFNTAHAFYDKLIASLDPAIGDETDAQLLHRINEASDTLQLLFAAWARYHLEDVPSRDKLYDLRQKWGEMAKFMLSEDS